MLRILWQWGYRYLPLFFIFITLLTHVANGQNFHKVEGKVVDENEKPVANAAIMVVGSKRGIFTDSLGTFFISLKQGDEIEVSHISFTSEKFHYHGQVKFDITLKRRDGAVDEVVVTGYTNIKKKQFAGSSSILTAKELERNGVPDVTKLLEGQFAGVSLQNVSGTFGAAPKLRIRGATSLSGDNKPLWVIDGIVIEDLVNISNEALTTGDMNTLLGSSVAGISPNDIADITILRDAAATALYGARAMNGVIVVNTKKGRASVNGFPHVDYTGNFSRYIKPSYSSFDIMNSADQMAVVMEEMNKGSFQMNTMLRGGNGGILRKMYELITTYDSTNGQFGLKNDTEHKLGFLNRYANANTDWFDILFKNSLMQEHSVSVSSGTDKFQTYGSVSYLKDDGYTVGNNVERYTGNFRTNFRLGKKFKGEILSTGSVRNQRAPGTRSAQTDNTYGTATRAFNINPYQYAIGTSRMMTAYDENGNLEYFKQNYAPFNILNELDNNYAKIGVVDYKIQGTASYDIIPSLNFSVVGAYRYQKSETQSFVTEKANMVKAYRAMTDFTTIGNNTLLYQDPDNLLAYPQTVLPEGGFYFAQFNTMKQYYLRTSMNYNKEFAQDHIVTVFGSMELRSTDRVGESFDGVGYQYDNGGLSTPYYLYFKQLGEKGGSYFSMQPTKERYLAYLGQLTYSYKNRYNITGSYRYDGSNKMGKSRTARWLPTWNVAGSWNINEEAFWKANDIISSATLRASYGLVANTGNATNTAATFYSAISNRRTLSDRETIINLSDLENSELTWEKQHELDLGTNLGFFKNRITLMMDYYRRRQFDLIGLIPNAGIGGQSSKIGNYADMKGQGFELTLEAKVIARKSWSWTTRFNIARNTNEITNLQVNPRVVNAISANGAAVLGGPVRSLYSVRFAGLDHNYGFPTFYGPEGIPTPYVNQQLYDLSFLQYEGAIDPVTTGGWYNSFTYKGFSISGLIKFSSGNAVRLSTNIENRYTDMAAMSTDMLDRWLMPGDEARTSIPALLDPLTEDQRIYNLAGSSITSGYPYNTYNNSTERTVSGDYVKLSFANLTYAIPSDICKKMGIRSSSFGITTNNILTIKADRRLKGQDPEFFNSGGVAIPQARYFTFTLKLGF